MKTPFHTLITGASRGLGRALALECARRRMNLVLVALPGEWLHDLAASIRVTYRVDVIAIETDLTEEGSCEGLHRIVCARELQVNMLINNAHGSSVAGFTRQDWPSCERQLRLHILATTQLTHLFLPLLRQHPQAHILNVASLTSSNHKEDKSLFGATRSFVSLFTRNLRNELAAEGIGVSMLCTGRLPGQKPRDADDRSARLPIMGPEAVAPLAIGGLLRNRARIVPGRCNQLLVELARLLPSQLGILLEEKATRSLGKPKTAPGIRMLLNRKGLRSCA